MMATVAAIMAVMVMLLIQIMICTGLLFSGTVDSRETDMKMSRWSLLTINLISIPIPGKGAPGKKLATRVLTLLLNADSSQA